MQPTILETMPIPVALCCPGCSDVLGHDYGWHVEIGDRKIHVLGRRIVLRCPKCRRIRAWTRPKKT